MRFDLTVNALTYDALKKKKINNLIIIDKNKDKKIVVLDIPLLCRLPPIFTIVTIKITLDVFQESINL